MRAVPVVLLASSSVLTQWWLYEFVRDRFRTTINVLGDSMGAGLVAHLSKGELDALGESDTVKMKKRSSIAAHSPEVGWNASSM